MATVVREEARASDDRIWLLILHVRQDLKLIVFLLFGMMVMLGGGGSSVRGSLTPRSPLPKPPRQSRASPRQSLDWRDWIGSVRERTLRDANLVLVAKMPLTSADVLDDENEYLKREVEALPTFPHRCLCRAPRSAAAHLGP
jgi:hypothetical protein